MGRIPVCVGESDRRFPAGPWENGVEGGGGGTGDMAGVPEERRDWCGGRGVKRGSGGTSDTPRGSPTGAKRSRVVRFFTTVSIL